MEPNKMWVAYNSMKPQVWVGTKWVVGSLQPHEAFPSDIFKLYFH